MIFGHKKSASPYTGDTLFFVLVYAIARLNKRSTLHRDRSIESLINKLSKPIKTASERRAYRSASWMPQHGRQYQRSSACRWRMGGIKSRLRCRCRDQRLNEPGTYCRMSNVRLLTRTVGEYSFAFGPQCMSPFSRLQIIAPNTTCGIKKERPIIQKNLPKLKISFYFLTMTDLYQNKTAYLSHLPTN